MDDKTMRRDSFEESMEMQDLEQLIKENRISESQKLECMTNEQQIEYLMEKEKAAKEFANYCGMKTMNIIANDTREG